MQSLATLSRRTKNGHVSTWYFVQTPTAFYAFGGCNGHDEIYRKDTAEELRDMYRTWVGYGYAPVQPQDSQLSLPLA